MVFKLTFKYQNFAYFSDSATYFLSVQWMQRIPHDMSPRVVCPRHLLMYSLYPEQWNHRELQVSFASLFSF